MTRNREVESRGSMRSGEHVLWEAHLIRGAAMRDMTVTVEIMVKIGRDFERSMLKVEDAMRSLQRMAGGRTHHG